MSESSTENWRLIERGGQGQSIALPKQGTLLLGASAERADVQLVGEGVDDVHCAIGCIKQGGWAIKDLGSRQGTRINGQTVGSKRLKAGDELRLGELVFEVSDGSSAAPATAAAAPKKAAGTARQVGGYRIERTLGKGGMGEVLLALQESLNRHVAIKLLSPQWAADRAFVAAFHSEARAAAALSHPNVVVVYDVGEDAGQHYLAMEYMPGGSLEERVVAEGRLPWREVLDILHDAASGLAYAESQGIVHRDIKPANLMLGVSGAVKIADLGLALNMDEQGAGDSAEGRKTFGTPHFISPEQARGLAVDARSDLYSLGATAYRLLSGRTPFQGETAREIVRARFVRDPAPLSQSVPDLPEGLHDLVQRLMQREPGDRFASARELLSAVDLLRLRADHGGPQESDAAAASPSKSKLPLALAGLVLLGLAAFFLWPQADDVPDASEPGVASQPEAPSSTGDRGNRGDAGSFFEASTAEDQALQQEENLELKLLRLEVDAVAALRHIPRDLTADERIVELELIAKGYAGTDSAGQALAEAEQLRGASQAVERLASNRSERLAEVLDSLRAHIGWPQPETNPAGVGELFARLASYLPPPELATDPLFQEGVQALRDEIRESLRDAAESRIEEAQELADKGQFEALGAALGSAKALLWPGEPADLEPESFAALRARCERYQARIDALPEAQRSYDLELARQDQLRLAACLGPDSSFIQQLGSLSLGAALESIAKTQSSLATEASRERLAGPRALLESAQRGLALLASTQAAGLWKRKTVSVPRNRTRSTAREAISVLPTGIMVAEDESSRLVTWAEFARTESGLALLFKSRLSRPWSDAERADIAATLGLPPLAHAMADLGPGFLGAAYGGLAPSVRAELEHVFDSPMEWIQKEAGLDRGKLDALAQDPPARSDTRWVYARIAREQAALGVLVEALEANQEGDYARSIALIETLLGSYAESLLVQSLSSGKP